MARGEMARFGMVEVVVMMMMIMAVRVAGNFKVEENSLAVMSPESLKGTYQSAIGNFGVPKYGGTLSGLVVYPAVNLKGCDKFPNDYFRAKSGERPNFPIVDRGDCYFATKVWNAQLAGAAAVLVADNKQEELITMDSPEEDPVASKYLQNISIPSALIAKDFSDNLKKALANKDQVSIKLDWRESLLHPDERVEYEFWTNSNDECGPQCDAQVEFVHSFRGIAQILERGGYTQFTPHYITWYCPQAFVESKQCKAQCINNGRYCAPDPEQDMSKGYDGKQVVTENLRALCVFKVTNESISRRPWKWWDYVTDYQIRCRMQDKNYGPKCAEEVIKSLSIDVEEVRKCMGNPDVDEVNEILKKEQVTQVGTGNRGDVTILPTLVINQRQYRGKLDKTAVLRAICSGYEEATDPPICLSEKIETNECEDNNGGCWQSGSITACKDTFRGRVCECPLVSGVQFEGDGYTHCEAIGPERCKVQNGGCWEETRDGVHHSACHHHRRKGCHCPRGFEGNGTAVGGCVDIDECARKLRCSCPQCKCKNTWGHYHCKCSDGLLYFHAQDTCINRKGPQSKTGWTIPLLIMVGLSVVGLGSYVLYRYRVRSYMDSEIRAIMAQYMPLDSQGDVQNHSNDSNDDI